MVFQTLEQLAVAKHFPPNSTAESMLLRCSQNGDLVPDFATVKNDQNNNPATAAGSWGEERTIRASFIHWLCTDQDAHKLIDPRGIQIFGAQIVDELFLPYVRLPFPLTFWLCRFFKYVQIRCMEVGELDLQGSWVEFLDADRIKVAGNFFLRQGFKANRGLSIAGAQVGGDLTLSGSTLVQPMGNSAAPKGVALNGDRAVIHGAVFLRDGFFADGDVRLPGVQIGGQLDCSDATFQGEVILRDAMINGPFLWTGIKTPGKSSLRLNDARLYSMVDEKKSWPLRGNLTLDGLTYRHCATNSITIADRIEWLNLTPRFAAQPYEQLAQVLRDHGDADGSKEVLVEMERKERGETWYEKPWSAVLHSAIGYGYYPGRAIWGLGILTGLSWVIFRRAKLAGAMAPTDKDAYAALKNPPSALLPHYPQFSPFVYSLENSLPLVKLGQVDKWQPDPAGATKASRTLKNPLQWAKKLCESPVFLRRFMWVQILLGWLLATFFLAGLTGIVQK
jgi:hypothetical protein